MSRANLAFAARIGKDGTEKWVAIGARSKVFTSAGQAIHMWIPKTPGTKKWLLQTVSTVPADAPFPPPPEGPPLPAGPVLADEGNAPLNPDVDDFVDPDYEDESW
jgi:hypothetical protein